MAFSTRGFVYKPPIWVIEFPNLVELLVLDQGTYKDMGEPIYIKDMVSLKPLIKSTSPSSPFSLFHRLISPTTIEHRVSTISSFICYWGILRSPFCQCLDGLNVKHCGVFSCICSHWTIKLSMQGNWFYVFMRFKLMRVCKA